MLYTFWFKPPRNAQTSQCITPSPTMAQNQKMVQAGVGELEGGHQEGNPVRRLLVEGASPEKENARNRIYLVTIFRVSADTGVQAGSQDVSQLSREAVGNAVRDALNSPDVGPLGGRSRQNGQVVEKLVVFQEAHQDGSKHVHVAVKLSSQQRFAAAKRALKIRRRLPSHWSCSARLGSARLGSAWLGSARLGSARLGSAAHARRVRPALGSVPKAGTRRVARSSKSPVRALA
jgi:hypothetical protein